MLILRWDGSCLGEIKSMIIKDERWLHFRTLTLKAKDVNSSSRVGIRKVIVTSDSTRFCHFMNSIASIIGLPTIGLHSAKLNGRNYTLYPFDDVRTPNKKDNVNNQLCLQLLAGTKMTGRENVIIINNQPINIACKPLSIYSESLFGDTSSDIEIPDDEISKFIDKRLRDPQMRQIEKLSTEYEEENDVWYSKFKKRVNRFN